MIKKGLSGGALGRLPLQDWQQEIRKHISLFFLESVFLHKKSLKREVAEPINILEYISTRILVFLVELLKE